MTPRDGALVISTSAVRRAVLLIVGLAVIVAVVYFGRTVILKPDPAATQIDRGAYQAVFLITNQVYFGKLEVDGDTYLLTEVFYLNQPEGGAPSQLVKRGGEPHGPREPMIIPASSVLYVENLRDDSAVVNGIKAFKAGQTSPPATAAPTATVRPSATR